VRGCNQAEYSAGVATWILTGSLENFEINVERGFDVVGFKQRRRRQAEEFEPGDEIVFYITGVQAFAGIASVRSPMFEDRATIWPQGTKKHPEDYPWRVEAEPVTVLERAEFVPAESLADELEHIRKWPPEHWQLAFQGQLRTVSDADAELLCGRIAAAAGAPASAI
jgi:predicted RNA-binding protein